MRRRGRRRPDDAADLGRRPYRRYAKALISAGTNDGDRAALGRLIALRDRVDAARVVWVVPASRYPAAQLVSRLATERGDGVLRIDSVLGPDRTRPTPAGYLRLANQLDF